MRHPLLVQPVEHVALVLTTRHAKGAGVRGKYRLDAQRREFFPVGRVKSNFLCNLGHGDPGKVMPKLPRLEFDEACTLL